MAEENGLVIEARCRTAATARARIKGKEGWRYTYDPRQRPRPWLVLRPRKVERENEDFETPNYFFR